MSLSDQVLACADKLFEANLKINGLESENARLSAENARLRKAIETATPPECLCYKIGSNVHRTHVKGCPVIPFNEWKKAALEVK